MGSRVRAALDKVGLLERERAMPITLSGGEQQRVGIARAVVGRPKILLADEPTGNLDQKTSANITDLLFDLNRQHQTTLIMVTHEPSLAERCQRQLVLENGVLNEFKA